MCKHPIKDLKVKSQNWVDHHPYGADMHYEWYLVCSSCGAKSKIYSQYSDYHNGIDEAVYQKLTRRRLDFEELRSLLKENNKVFHDIRIDDRALKSRVMSNPRLECRIQDLETMVANINTEIKQLRDKYNRGEDCE